MYCPVCGTQNNNDSFYCMNCGNPINSAVVQGNQDKKQPGPQINNIPGYSPYQNQGGPYYPPGRMGSYSPFSTREGSAFLHIWGPFAGYGTQRNHNGWLMDNKGDKSNEIIEKIRNKFSDRMIPNSIAEEKELVAKGLIVEKRPYFLLNRKMVTIGLYITEFGKDLYVSIASFLKPPISNPKAFILLFMLLFAGYTSCILPMTIENQINGLGMGLLGSALGNSLGGSFGSDFSDANPLGLISLLCFIGPLGFINYFLLGLYFVFSGYKWLTEKDFLAPLRTTPNEFNEDDLMAMEKAVEQTVRIAMDEIGLDPDDLKPVISSERRRLI